LEVFQWIVGIVVVVGILALVFLPSILAFRRGHPRATTILVVNVLLGGFGIGWIIAMALLYSPERGKTLVPPAGDGVLVCPSCGFGYLLADYRADAIEIFCSRCGGALPRESPP
jgi:hypothetical protein